MLNLFNKIENALICPIDTEKLTLEDECFVCKKCGRRYSIDENILHFICNEDERPHTPSCLSQYIEKTISNLAKCFSGKRAMTRKEYDTNEYVKNYVDFSAVESGIIVDIASGPSAGYLHGTLDRMGHNALLIATDACPCVIHHYSILDKDKNFIYFDVDLDKHLPFIDQSVDVFTGVLMCNVQNYKELLSEIARCLKTGGKAVFHEVFYSENSESYKYLCAQNAVYASSEIYIHFCETLGLRCVNIEICWKSVGKVDPRDGMPLAETDEWYRKNIYFEKV